MPFGGLFGNSPPMDVECRIEGADRNYYAPGFADNECLISFHASPVSRFHSIAWGGLFESNTAEGGRCGKEGPGVFSAPTLYQTHHYIYEQAEHVAGGKEDDKHVIIYCLRLRDSKTKRRKSGKKVSQYITPKEHVMMCRLYYAQFSYKPKAKGRRV